MGELRSGTAALGDELLDELPVRQVGEIVGPKLLTCTPETRIAEAAAMMRQARVSSIVVTRNAEPVGIWTERDAARLDFSDQKLFDRPISEVMSPAVKSINKGAPINEAGVRFKREHVRHLLVVDDAGHAVGMLSQTDVILNHGVEHYLTFRDVRSVMATPMPTVASSLPIAQAAESLRAGNGEAVIVWSEGEGEAEPGILTERDLVRLAADRYTGPVGTVASRPVVHVSPSATLLSARNLFAQHGIRHLAVRDETGAFVGLLSFSAILTILQYEYAAQLNNALRERDEALLRSRKDLVLARQVIEASGDGVMIVGEDGLIEYVNPAFTQITGFTAAEAVGQSPRILKSGMQDDGFYREMWEELLERGNWQGEVWNRRKNGDLFAEHLRISTIRDESGRLAKFAALFSDVTERKKDEERVRSLAYFDPLTGLPNRRLLMDRLDLAIHAAHRHKAMLALMFLDLDLFKRINDTLGHDVGDGVLKEVSDRLQACLREGDTVARMGGDEFVILMPQLADAADAASLAERIIESVKAGMHLAGRELFVTTSVGIAIYPDDGVDADTLMKNADTAMYQAKAVGRNSFQMFSAAMNARSSQRRSLESSLRGALERQEFSLVYQVKVDMTTSRLCGCEALVRWTHPDMGAVAPNEFIPLAEKAGLMLAIGEWVIREACAQNMAWRARGLSSGRVAVNVSPQQLRSPDFAFVVDRALADTGLPADLLELELTEAVLDHPEMVADTLARLHERGVVISLDDFGTRQSALSTLSHLPIDCLKIDRSVVAGLGQAFGDRDLAVAIVHLAHALGMRAVAEGVETMEQVTALKAAGCDEIQGWLVGRAVRACDMEHLFDQRLLPAG